MAAPDKVNSFILKELDPVVQSIVSLTSWLMTNSLTVVATVFSDTLIFLLQKSEYCKSYSHFFSAKNINVFGIFKERNSSTLLSFEQLGPALKVCHSHKISLCYNFKTAIHPDEYNTYCKYNFIS